MQKKKPKSTRALSDDEIRTLWTICDQLAAVVDDNEIFRLTQVCLLTGLPVEMVARTEWWHVDFRQCIWWIPVSVNGEERLTLVRIPSMVLELFAAMEHNGPFIFSDNYSEKVLSAEISRLKKAIAKLVPKRLPKNYRRDERWDPLAIDAWSYEDIEHTMLLRMRAFGVEAGSFRRLIVAVKGGKFEFTAEDVVNVADSFYIWESYIKLLDCGGDAELFKELLAKQRAQKVADNKETSGLALDSVEPISPDSAKKPINSEYLRLLVAIQKCARELSLDRLSLASAIQGQAPDLHAAVVHLTRALEKRPTDRKSSDAVLFVIACMVRRCQQLDIVPPESLIRCLFRGLRFERLFQTEVASLETRIAAAKAFAPDFSVASNQVQKQTGIQRKTLDKYANSAGVDTGIDNDDVAGALMIDFSDLVAVLQPAIFDELVKNLRGADKLEVGSARLSEAEQDAIMQGRPVNVIGDTLYISERNIKADGKKFRDERKKRQQPNRRHTANRKRGPRI